jgi:serine/threonine protein kinase
MNIKFIIGFLISDSPANKNIIDKQRIKYMPPESLEFLVEEVNFDIWSYGCILIDIFSKDPVYKLNMSPEEIYRMHSLNLFPTIPNDINGLLKDIITRCLDKNPGTRIAIEELMQNIKILFENIIHSNINICKL